MLRRTLAASACTRLAGGCSRLDGWLQALPEPVVVGGCLVICAAIVRGVLFEKGIPMVGDWVAVGRETLPQFTSVWDPIAHNGALAFDFRESPWAIPLAELAGRAGSASFFLVNKLFVAAVLLFPGTLAYVSLRRFFHATPWVSALAGLYVSLNPWAASRAASGHFPLLLAYSTLVPILGLGWRPAGPRRAVFAGLLIAASGFLDLQGFAISALVFVAAVACAEGRWWEKLLRVVVALAVSIALSCFWLVPLSGTYLSLARGLTPSGYDLTAMRTIAQESGPLHLLGMRSYWWIPFSDGLYKFGIASIPVDIGLTLLPITALASLGALLRRGVPSARSSLALCAIGLLPSAFAFWLPALYLAALRLPGAVMFRDPNKLLSVAVVGVTGALALLGGGSRLLRAAAIVTVAFAALPWTNGSLSGTLAPVRADNELAAVRWLNAHAAATERVLWFPVELYIYPPWAVGGVSDPSRFWTSVPQLNPIFDAAFELSPSYSTNLLLLEQYIETAPSQELEQVLADEGVRFVATRSDVAQPAGAAGIASRLAHAPGISLVAKYGAISIFRVLGNVRTGARLATRAVIYNGTWEGLAVAAALGDGQQIAHLSDRDAAVWNLLHKSPSLGLVITNLWNAVYDGQPFVSLPGGDQTIIDPSGRVFRRFPPARSFVVDKPGIVAFNVLAANDALRLTCVGDPHSALLTYQQPDGRARWLAIECARGAVLRVEAPSFISGYAYLSRRAYLDRLALIGAALPKSGSGYVILRNDFIKLGNTVQTHRENPLMLPSGQYKVRILCVATCAMLGGRTTIEIVNDTYPTEHLVMLEGSADATSLQARDSVPAGYYILRLSAEAGRVMRALTVSSAAAHAPDITTALDLPEDEDTRIPQGLFLEMNTNPGPWRVLTRLGSVGPVPADQLGIVYYVALAGDVALPSIMTTSRTWRLRDASLVVTGVSAVLIALWLVLGERLRLGPGEVAGRRE